MPAPPDGHAFRSATLAGSARLILDDNRTIGAAVREGLGIAQRYRPTEETAIASGEVVEVLADFEPAPAQFRIYYPSQNPPAKLRAFVDWFCAAEPALPPAGLR